MRSLRWYIALPWTVRSEIREDKGVYYVIRVDELPGLLATGRDDREVAKNFWEALESHLLSYLNNNEEPPVPESVKKRLKERLQAQPLPSLQETGRPVRIQSESNVVVEEERIPVYA